MLSGEKNKIGTKIRDYFHLRGLRLKAATEKCNTCTVCSLKCPMNIDVMAQVKNNKINDNECILCGTCIDNCKQKAIRFSYGK